MAILKLPNVGDTHTMQVTLCEQVTGTYGEQVKFSDGTDFLFLPQSSADQQLKRIFGDAFSYIDACGNALTFSRSANTKRPGASPYWNIAPAAPATQSNAKRLAPPQTEVIGAASAPIASNDIDGARRRIADAYLALYRMVRATIDDDASAAQAATATIWITWNQRGIQPDGVASSARAVATDDNAAPPIKHPTPSGKRITPQDALPEQLPPATKYDDDLPF